MPTLLAPPPSVPAAAPVRRPFPPSLPSRAPAQIDLPAVSFFGRTLAEYAQFFALDLPALRRRDVLDVAAGPSSFVAEACARGIDAVAVDPLYAGRVDELTARIDGDYARMLTQMRAKPALFRMKSFPSFDAAEADRRAAAQRFLADFSTHSLHGRYVAGALPRLPFFDDSFDLVLCAHLLFIYANRFDFDWHVAACRELARVSAGEVRIHPVCGPDGRPYPKLAALRRELRAGGIESEVVRVDYEFFIGSGSMLVLRKGAT
ncbi:MAG: class I SAM-dependent methyltransferase [Verrucomicrobia bacterium]|nr:class I SAM-dependent methyltransferase [Verrucomicrobiota bacterium]